ncbi:hypothetical protein CUMW_259110 [Citrus unshiu]|nr:hypothetical protein CUMW_259110 [Citrus unshiu]
MSIGSAYTSGRYVFLVAFISGRLLFNPVFCSYHIAETIRAGAEPVAWPTWCLYVLNTGSRAGYEMRSSLTEVLPVTEPKENETISTQQLAVASEWRLLRKFSSGCNAITIILSLRVRMVLDWGIKQKEAEQDCGKEKDFSESLNSGFDGSPCYCQESHHVRSCSSFHQPEPEPIPMDNSENSGATGDIVREEEDEEEEEGERRKNEDDQLLLEALRPPLDLKELEIRFYRGNTVFPSWMTSLTNLKSLDLSFCENCEQLPPLGKLPSLEQLFISYMSNVKRVGDEFLGIESDHHDSSSSSSVVIAFPKLKSLTIELLDELEEWDYGITRTGNTFINIMPRSRAGYEMRSLLVEGLSETEPKENENISRQQLAAGREWSPLKIFPTHCTAITIVHATRDCEINESLDIGRAPCSGGGGVDGSKACGQWA